MSMLVAFDEDIVMRWTPGVLRGGEILEVVGMIQSLGQAFAQ